MRWTIVGVFLFSLIGCWHTPNWTSMTKSEQEQAADRAECNVMAAQSTTGITNGIDAAVARGRTYNLCMKGKGYFDSNPE